MTTIALTHVAALGGALSHAASDVRRWLAYRDTVADLRKLSAKELADIGVDGGVEDFAWDIASKATKG